MGGNSRAIDRLTGEVKMFEGRQVFASPIDLKKIDEKKFKDDMIHLLFEIDSHLGLERDTWEGILGSARNFFNLPVGEFSNVKSTLGDIDVAIPEENIEELWDVLASLEGKENSRGVVYIGQNRKKLRKPSINAVFAWKGHFVQVDFVALPFRGERLDPFATFSHSSPWEDAQRGLKGVAHKFLLQTLTWAISHEENIVVLTDKSPTTAPHTARLKIMHEPPRMMSFSVDKGLRARLLRQNDQWGRPLVVNGLNAYKELPTNVSDYVTEPESIFMILFGKRPSEMDFAEFQSFQGLLRLCTKYLQPKVVHLALDNMIRYKLFGSGQAMSRDSAEIDKQIKNRIIDVAKASYPSFTEADCPIKSLQAKYYESYKEREVSE